MFGTVIDEISCCFELWKSLDEKIELRFCLVIKEDYYYCSICIAVEYYIGLIFDAT